VPLVPANVCIGRKRGYKTEAEDSLCYERMASSEAASRGGLVRSAHIAVGAITSRGAKPELADCSAALLEKTFEQLPRFRLRHGAINLRPVMAGRRRKELHAVFNRAALGIGGAVIEPAKAGEGDRARAHRTRLERDIKVAVVEPLGAEESRGAADGDDLSMRGRIAVGKRAVAGLRDDFAAADYDAADRHLAACAGGTSFLKRQVHEGSH